MKEHNISIVLMQTPWIVLAIVLGIIGCIALYKGDYRAFFKSSVFTKTIMWLPLYLGFCLASYSLLLASIAALLIMIGALYEWGRCGKVSVVGYLIYFLTGCIAWPVSVHLMGSSLWVSIVLASVVSDVMAFFFGKTLGRHHLPKFLNNRKSYEGVLGQLVGGVIGVMITNILFGVEVVWWWGLVIGLLSTVGDLVNSFTKRKLAIDDWGNTIPGHGGVMDRFSSLNAVLIGAALLFLVIN
ncbi:MAG: phosphatidate cytidylyltransferase [Candidatus Microsaccharimonas sp.]